MLDDTGFEWLMMGGAVIVRRAQSAENCWGHQGTEAGKCAEVEVPISSFGPRRDIPFGLVIARRIFVAASGSKWMVGTTGGDRMHG